MTESSRKKFVRLAENRVNTTIKTIRLIGNLSNKSSYSWTSKDVEIIFKALDRELRNAKSRFESGTGGDASSFTLD